MAVAARNRILAAARTRFASDGVYAATLDDVRRDAGVSVGAVYHHFPDKERLAEAVWLDALERYQAGVLDVLRASSGARDGIEGAVAYHLDWIAAHREDATLLFSARPATAREPNRAFFRAVRAWRRRGAAATRQSCATSTSICHTPSGSGRARSTAATGSRGARGASPLPRATSSP